MNTVNVVHLDKYPNNNNDHNTRMVFLNKIIHDRNIGIILNKQINTSIEHDKHLETSLKNLSYDVRQKVIENSEINGIQTYINTYKENKNVNILFKRITMHHSPDKLIAAIAHPYSQIHYYSRQRIAIPPSQWIIDYTGISDELPPMKINLPHLQRKYSTYSPNDKIALMRHAICTYYTLSYHKEFAIQEKKREQKDDSEDSSDSEDSDSEPDEDQFSGANLKQLLAAMPRIKRQLPQFEPAGAKLEKLDWTEADQYNKINQFDILHFPTENGIQKYKVIEFHDNGYYAKKINISNGKQTETNEEYYIRKKEDYGIRIRKVKTMTWDLIQQEAQEDMLGEIDKIMAKGDNDGDVQVQITKSKYDHFRFEKIRKSKKIAFFRRLKPITTKDAFQLSLQNWIKNRNALLLDLDKQEEQFGLQEYIQIGQLVFHKSIDKLFIQNALKTEIYDRKIERAMEHALHEVIRKHIDAIKEHPGPCDFEVLKQISQLRDTRNNTSPYLQQWWKDTKRNKLKLEIQYEQNLKGELGKQKYKYIKFINDQDKEKETLLKVIVNYYNNNITMDDAILIKNQAYDIITRGTIMTGEYYMDNIKTLQDLYAKAEDDKDKFLYQNVLNQLYDEDEYFNECIYTQQTVTTQSDEELELYEPASASLDTLFGTLHVSTRSQTAKEAREAGQKIIKLADQNDQLQDRNNELVETVQKLQTVIKKNKMSAQDKYDERLQKHKGIVVFLFKEFGKVSTDDLFRAFKEYIQFGNNLAKPGDQQDYYGETYKDFFQHFSQRRRSVKVFNDPVRYKYNVKNSVFGKDYRTYKSVVENVDKINVVRDLKNLNTTSSSNNWNTITKFALYEKYNFFIPAIQQHMGETQWEQMNNNLAFDDFVYTYCLLYTLIFNQ